MGRNLLTKRALVIGLAVIVVVSTTAFINKGSRPRSTSEGVTSSTEPPASETTATSTGGVTTTAAVPTSPTAAPYRDFDSEVAPGIWQMECDFSHFNADDPIVFPNQPGAAHMHTFYGNTTTNAASTGSSLLNGRSSCGRDMATSDKSAYWVPSLYKKNADGTSTLVSGKNQKVWVYYRRVGSAKGPKVQPFPAGLRMIVGDHTATSAQQLGIVHWDCGHGGPQYAAIPTCSGEPMHAKMKFPSCWDGKNVDSPNHKSHMAYAAPNGTCPPTHPVSLPEITLEPDYLDIKGGPDYYLSSGGVYSMHGDFFNAWDSQVLNALVAECLNTASVCADIYREGNTIRSGETSSIRIDLSKY